MTPQDIADLLLREGSNVAPDKYDESTEPAEARQRRTELLVPVLAACQEAWSSGSEEIDLIAEKLGDGSRDVAWRAPLGDSGILEFFIRIFAQDGLRQGLQVHTLRLVGNSCADTDENRNRVVEGDHMALIINHLQYENLIPFTIPVLFNILVDYEPAQQNASQSFLNQRLIDLLSSPSLSNFTVFVPYFCKILALLISQDCEPALASPNTVRTLLTLAISVPFRDDLDDFISLVSVAASYLAHESFQQAIVQGPEIQLLMSAFYHSHTHFPMTEIDDAETVDQLKKLHSSLLAVLADVTGQDLFAEYNSLHSQVAQTLLAWLQSSNPPVQAAACLGLGNLSRSDKISIPLVQTYFAHLPLIKLLSNPAVSEAQLVHSALSFLKNLAIPVQNKPHLGGLLDSACLPRIYGLDASPQVQFTAVSLTRLLLVNCPPNVQCICTPLSADPSSPAHERSNVGGITSLFERSDAEPTRLEAARALAALCRVLHSGPVLPLLPDWVPPVEEVENKDGDPQGENENSQDEESKRREYFYKKHHDMAKPLAFLVTQSKWPSLRSEGWFVFALMCRSKEGAVLTANVLQTMGSMTALIKAITGRDTALSETGYITQIGQGSAAGSSPDQQVTAMVDGLGLEPQQANPKQQESMARADRENALVLVTELLRRWGRSLPGLRQSILEDLVKEGTEIVAAQKAAA